MHVGDVGLESEDVEEEADGTEGAIQVFGIVAIHLLDTGQHSRRFFFTLCFIHF